MAALPPVLVVSLIGGFVSAVASGASAAGRKNSEAISAAFNSGQNKVVLPDGELYGLVSATDKEGNTVVSVHAVAELDGKGEISKLAGDNKMTVTIPARKSADLKN
ncbi:MAG: hypothetical protein AB7H77_10780 [Bdellovibrionales bacterium]